VTLVEVLVVVGIIAMLCAILLPATQMAREAARRVHCRANLRQLGVALHHYLSDHGVFPAASHFHYGSNSNISVYTRLLPYLEQQPIYDSVNFDVGVCGILGRITNGGDEANYTVARTPVEVLLCPSDSNRFLGAGCNYRVCVGSIPTLFDPRPLGAPFTLLRWRTPADISDGLAQTAFMSERPFGDGDELAFALAGDFWFADQTPTLDDDDADRVLQGCSLKQPVPAHYSESGHSWFYGGFATTWYNHVQSPNGKTADCSIHPIVDGCGLYEGSFAARSRHNQGVNVLLGDGAVRFVSTEIDTRIWRALGTSSGGDSVGTEF
jgi:prepilin-type processing-associated H-X9-DG protein